MCLDDPTSIILQGSGKSTQPTHLLFTLGPCSSDCATEEEIIEFKNSGLHLIYYKSSQSYDPDDYENAVRDIIVPETTTLNGETKESIWTVVEERVLTSEHKFFDLGYYPEELTFYDTSKEKRYDIVLK